MKNDAIIAFDNNTFLIGTVFGADIQKHLESYASTLQRRDIKKS